MVDDGSAAEEAFADRYPSIGRRAHTFRSRRANGQAVLVFVAALVVLIVVLAFTA